VVEGTRERAQAADARVREEHELRMAKLRAEVTTEEARSVREQARGARERAQAILFKELSKLAREASVSCSITR